MIYHLKDQVVFLCRGEADAFIKAYTSNTPDKPKNCFLDAQGKIVACFYQHRVSSNEIYFILGKSFAPRLEEHLGKYLPFLNILLDKKEEKVYFDLEGDFDSKSVLFSVKESCGKIFVSKETVNSTVSDDEFTLFRVKNNIPWQGIDYDREMLLCISENDMVSYEKGCYLGQEIIARVHSRSKPPKKIYVADVNDFSPEDRSRITSKTKDPATGKIYGFIFLPNI